ncbi:MAG: efflux RND transporter periplasmic adaptor subunit [Candidatus Latescibacteria bacterium]|nr:efflux RND transporter periplasmic adaptor subunit [Candidatus Latescibacterota bacterium]
MKSRQLVAVAVATCGFWACGATESDSGAEAETPAVVGVEAVEQVQVPIVATAVGSTQPYTRVLPSTRIMGRIAALYYSAGDSVRKGQRLARVESRDLQARRQQAESQLAAARAVLAHAEKNVQRLRNLRRNEAIPQQQLDAVEMEHAQARAAVEAAVEGVAEAESHLHYTTVLSPLDGVVVEKFIEVGDMARPGVALFAVEQRHPSKILLAISERDSPYIQVGQEVEAQIVALDKKAVGRVEALVPAADPASHTFRAEVLVANPDGAIGSGMFARVRFAKGARPGLLMPAAALVQRGQLQGAYVVVGERAHLRWLRLGAPLDGQLEVLAGLAAGDRVVVAGKDGLYDGRPVEVQGHD